MDVHRLRLNALFGLDWKRAPAHTSLRLILLKLDEKELEQAFREHAQSLLQNGSETSGTYIAFDGKTLKGRFDHALDQKAAQLLKAFAKEEKIILGHLPITEKSHEIQAVQTLIQELGLSGCIFTAIRGHWAIENCENHVKDVTFLEDASRIRRKPGIFARLRSLALNILRKNGVESVTLTL